VCSGVRGKVVDRIEHQFEDGRLYLHVCFRDKTEVSSAFSSRLAIEEAMLTDMSTGNSKPLKEYGSMKGEMIVQTEYVIRIVTPKGTPERNLRLGRQFTPTIDKAIGVAIQRTGAKALRRYVGSCKLDKCFRLHQ
jgi:hypothetical protein